MSRGCVIVCVRWLDMTKICTSALSAVMSRGCVCMLVCMLVVGYELDMYLCLECGDV